MGLNDGKALEMTLQGGITGKSENCFWGPSYWFKKFLQKCVYLHAKNFIKEAIPVMKDVEIALYCL